MKESEAHARLWKELVRVEEYFRTGISNQLKNSTSFGGDDAIPIRNAYLILNEVSPFLSEEVKLKAEENLELAIVEFNKLLSVFRQLIHETNEQKKSEIATTHMNSILEVYRHNLEELKNIVSNNNSNDTASNISFSGNNYGTMTISGRDSSSITNISISDLIKKIDESNINEEDKKDIKRKINEIISHPLLTTVLGGISGGIIN